MPDIENDSSVRDLIRMALDEDIGSGDATTLALVPDCPVVTASVLTRSNCVISGTGIAGAVFSAVDPGLKCCILTPDGARAAAGETVLTVEGRAGGVLTAERTALNFMQRMCGIATLTATFVEKAAPHGATILDTRKTTPMLRVLEKYAVLCGGGQNHRAGLFDRVMIKDNHRRLCSRSEEAGLDAAILKAREKYPDLAIEVEVESTIELEQALKASPEWILLDNMPPAELESCVRLCNGRCLLEASGGITLQNVEEVAATGVDAISLGCLTHSAPSVDLSLEVQS